MRLHLLDATYELFRAHHALPPIEDPAGRPVAAVRGLMATVLALLEGGEVTHLAAATDRVIRSFRNDLYPPYKSEEGVPPELLEQFPRAERALEALGVVVWPQERFEADDALAAGTARFAGQVDQVVLLSPDKDLAQCVQADRVVLHDRGRGITLDEDGVRAKFGVGPASIPDFLALVGDASDGLPGLPGWGPKSAGTVLSRYGHLEDVPLDPGLWEVEVRGAGRLAETLAERLEEALFFRYLALLRREVPIAEDLGDLEWRGVPREAFLAFCDELGFQGIRERPSRWR